MFAKKEHSLTILLTLVAILAIGASAVAQAPVLSHPILTSLVPAAASAKSGAASALVVVTGRNFAQGTSKVQVQGTTRATTVINSEAVAFELTGADLVQPQTLLITVVNESGSKSFKSNALPFVVLP